MERLSGLDAGFLYLETPTLLMHTLKLLVLPPFDEPESARAQLIEAVRSRMHVLPILRRRLLEVPLGLHHPLWIECAEVDVARHVLCKRVRSPGGPRELDSAIAAIASQPLDRAEPLWELWLLKGREDRALTVLVKLHHALADGATALRLLEALTTHDRHAVPIAHPHAPWQAERLPSRSELIRSALKDRLREAAQLPALLKRTWKAALDLRAHTLVPRPPRPMLDAPRTSFNGALTACRSLATVALPLALAMRVKASAKVSLNDVILALVGSALRSYLQARGELPERALIASVPSSAESEPSAQLSGNHVSSLFTTLATDVADDWQRLMVIHEVMQQAKKLQALVPATLLGDWLQYAPPDPAAWVVAQWSRWQLADHVPPPVNVVVSFVRGPSEQRFADGRPLRAIYSVGPILEGIGLNITVWSYLDQLHVSVLACNDLTPDPQRISAGIAVALDNLVKAASLGRSPGSSRAGLTALSP